jgi:hypothetical protein
MSDKMPIDIDIMYMRFEYLNTNMVSNIKYPDVQYGWI